MHRQQAAQQDRDDLFSDGGESSLIDENGESKEQLLFYRSGLQPTTLKRLKRGQIRIEAELDLHGFSVNEARIELTEFVHFAMTHALRCVRIIHGKGKGKGKSSYTRQPILKRKVDYWLRQRDEVLAFCSAIGRDGGSGATYLLLRRMDK